MSSTVEIAKLTSNPFTLVPNETVTNWAGYEPLRRALVDVIESCRSDRVGLSEFVILHGDLGTGKSHALRYLKHLILETEKDDYESPCVYLETFKVAASMSFLALYRKVMDLLIPHVRETANWLDRVVEETAKKRKPDVGRHDQAAEIDRIYADPAVTPTFPPLALLLKGIKNDSMMRYWNAK